MSLLHLFVHTIIYIFVYVFIYVCMKKFMARHIIIYQCIVNILIVLEKLIDLRLINLFCLSIHC